MKKNTNTIQIDELLNFIKNEQFDEKQDPSKWASCCNKNVNDTFYQ